MHITYNYRYHLMINSVQHRYKRFFHCYGECFNPYLVRSYLVSQLILLIWTEDSRDFPDASHSFCFWCVALLREAACLRAGAMRFIGHVVLESAAVISVHFIHGISGMNETFYYWFTGGTFDEWKELNTKKAQRFLCVSAE